MIERLGVGSSVTGAHRKPERRERCARSLAFIERSSCLRSVCSRSRLRCSLRRVRPARAAASSTALRQPRKARTAGLALACAVCVSGSPRFREEVTHEASRPTGVLHVGRSARARGSAARFGEQRRPRRVVVASPTQRRARDKAGPAFRRARDRLGVRERAPLQRGCVSVRRDRALA